MALKQPFLVPHATDDNYELSRDYKLELGEATVVVPKYFRFDGASIPAAAWPFSYTPFHPDVMLPSLIHDWMYYNHQEDRDVADDIFYTLLKENGVSNVAATAMWVAVKLGGGLVWDNDEEDIGMMIQLCKKVYRRPNFDRYRFPDEIIAQVTRK